MIGTGFEIFQIGLKNILTLIIAQPSQHLFAQLQWKEFKTGGIISKSLTLDVNHVSVTNKSSQFSLNARNLNSDAFN